MYYIHRHERMINMSNIYIHLYIYIDIYDIKYLRRSIWNTNMLRVFRLEETSHVKMILDFSKNSSLYLQISAIESYYIFKERGDYNIFLPFLGLFVWNKQTCLVEFKPQYNIEFYYLRLTYFSSVPRPKVEIISIFDYSVLLFSQFIMHWFC